MASVFFLFIADIDIVVKKSEIKTFHYFCTVLLLFSFFVSFMRTPLQINRTLCFSTRNNYLLTYDSYGPVHNRFHRGEPGECITWASGGEGALETPGPFNGIERILALPLI
jgi:hypothetical protein